MALVLLWFATAAVIPRWWGQRVANVVDSSLTVGALYGLFIGFVFTVAPLLLLLVVIRWRTSDRTWLGWLGWIILVLLLAAPNLMTLSIVLSNNGAAKAGRIALDADGPGFRLWSLIGAILGGLAVFGTMYLVRSRQASRRRAAALRDELRSREQN